mmetsp:Transcript_20277/g.33944  ORF Transcript_20277/g.33944 Transcript_20277/m.33944 type:complete len:96 (-) Transcript_20277:2414-2701(-)|eukprot:CAMPEP_0175022932 /NCGR_PEP_ID=MMETSP0005-20121125/15583_1 /TAXON_ID=420556 /ORGANISM="Ochromonas sp., Strain CCMP1393" /LENGTH=95 /DNA_ID=CAMNT_0016281223 /DNA_START=419 /DNA_END=706 /DNA_ORIENTATION=+
MSENGDGIGSLFDSDDESEEDGTTTMLKRILPGNSNTHNENDEEVGQINGSIVSNEIADHDQMYDNFNNDRCFSMQERQLELVSRSVAARGIVVN